MENAKGLAPVRRDWEATARMVNNKLARSVRTEWIIRESTGEDLLFELRVTRLNENRHLVGSGAPLENRHSSLPQKPAPGMS